MKTSAEILQKAGLLPKLQLGIKSGAGVKSTGKHTVVMISDKIVSKPPQEAGDDGYYVRYTVTEDGVEKQYDTRLKQKGGNDPSYFVQAMAAIPAGEVVTLEMKKAGIKNYIEILRPSTGEVQHVDDDDGGSEEGRDIQVD